MSCPKFPKIDTLYERDENFKVDTTKLRRPEFAIPREWVVTEKIDGTNVRVSLEDVDDSGYSASAGRPMWAVRFYGRTENAQMPTFLLEHLQKTFTLDKMKSLWCGPGEAEYPIVLYGEGYGAKIQKGGGNYRRDGDVSFRLFDVLIGDTWLRRADVEDVAEKLNIKPVPFIKDVDERYVFTLDEIANIVVGIGGLRSEVAREEGTPSFAEGVVAFTDPPLFNGQGKRLRFKLKTKDF